MFALPGLLLLVAVDWLRPQEHYTFLRALPLLHGATALAALGFVLDLRLGLSRFRAAPHLVPVLAFFGWCLLTVLARAPEDLGARASLLLIPLALYLLIAHALQSFRALEIMATAVLAFALTLSAIGVDQGFSSPECHAKAWGTSDVALNRDGRPCETRRDCEAGEGAEPGADYACERPGLLGTSTIGGRVRYRGTLGDPNELALVAVVALPLAFALYDRRRSLARAALVGVAIGLMGLCAVLTKSRTGQIVFVTVLGMYFARRIGWKRGLVAALVLALPLVIFGGRSGAESASSTKERTECWWVGMHLFTQYPLLGVGSGQFTEHHYLTAHNTFVLAAAELGLPGLVLWSVVMWISLKILIQALRARVEPVARTWALGLLALITGLVVGMMFLSFAYKDTLWLYVGLTGVLYQAIRRHDPSFEVRFGRTDLLYVVLADAAGVLLLVGYTGSKLGW
jgi:hypothetical protein